MSVPSDSVAAENGHQVWLPVLEVAAREVFELMLGCELTPASTPEETDDQLDMTSMVGLAGRLCGVMSIRSSRKAAGLMASKMLGVDPAKVGPETTDAFGEVCNMIAGNFKNKISGLSDGCMLSVPTVITGNDYILHALADSAGLEVRFLFETMPIVIALQIHS